MTPMIALCVDLTVYCPDMFAFSIYTGLFCKMSTSEIVCLDSSDSDDNDEGNIVRPTATTSAVVSLDTQSVHIPCVELSQHAFRGRSFEARSV